jgi:amphi-Trp domain-containing protein
MKKPTVKLRRTADANTIAQILTDLATSLRQGKICVESGEDFVALDAGEGTPFELELQAEQKKNKQKFELELSWRTGPPQPIEEGDFKISSHEPEVSEPARPDDES